MENLFYYTFSTIAQSLAALMAILGAFAMFRLQTIDSDLRARSYSLMRSFGGHEMLNELLVHECYGDFLKELDAHVASIESLEHLRKRASAGYADWFHCEKPLYIHWHCHFLRQF